MPNTGRVQIEYMPPEIKGKVPQEVQDAVSAEVADQDVWKVLVAQTFFEPASGRAKYQVSAYYGNEGRTRDQRFGE